MVSPNYREEAERIVAEEKAQGEKMPDYEVSPSSRRPHYLNYVIRVWRSLSLLKKWATELSPTCIRRSSGRQVARSLSKWFANTS